MPVLEAPDIEEQQHQQVKQSAPQSPYTVVRWLVGGLLLFAAAMKGYELATAPVAGTSLLTTRWFLVIGVEFELALGLFLIAGLLPKIAWWVSLLCFTGFAALTAYKAWMDDSDCGCFGRAHVDPRVTLAIDLVTLVGLLAFRPGGHAFRIGHSNRLIPVAVLLLLVGIPGGWLMATAKSASVNDDGFVSAGSFIVLEPEKWAGKPFPLFDHIDIGEQLKTGKWIVILYSQSCSHCIEAMPKYLKAAKRLADEGGATRMALVQIPPVGDGSQMPSSLPASVVTGQLSASREWFAETPVEVQLENGRVVRAVSKGDGLSWWSEGGSWH